MISTRATAFRKTITKETDAGQYGACQSHAGDRAPDSGRSDPLHDQAHQETSRQPACFVARTNPLPPQHLPAQQGGFAENRRSRLQLVAKAPSGGAPGDQFHGSIVNLLQPKLDLPRPRFCRTFVDGRVQALNQGINQRGTRLQRQCEGVAKQFRRMARHESILPRRLWAGQGSSRELLPKKGFGKLQPNAGAFPRVTVFGTSPPRRDCIARRSIRPGASTHRELRADGHWSAGDLHASALRRRSPAPATARRRRNR